MSVGLDWWSSRRVPPQLQQYRKDGFSSVSPQERIDKAVRSGSALLYSRLSLTELEMSASRAGKKRKICSSQGPACVVHSDSQASASGDQPDGEVRMPLQCTAEPPSDGHEGRAVPGCHCCGDGDHQG